MHEVERLYKATFKRAPISALVSPPDVFAVCAYFAKITGCYRALAPSCEETNQAIADAVDDGKAWRLVLNREVDPQSSKFPPRVVDAWVAFGKEVARPIEDLARDEGFVRCCLALIAACDEACEGVGIPSPPNGSYFELITEIRIGTGTLCRFIPSDSLRVLPKQHTPQSGFNIRSLTHHLALCSASEVEPVWVQMPAEESRKPTYNLLLAPWPLEMQASDLVPAKRRSRKHDEVGYFDYSPRGGAGVRKVQAWIDGLLRKAAEIGQPIDLVIFPECALTIPQWRSVVKVARRHGVSLISGVRSAPKDDGCGENSLRIKVPYDWHEEVIQDKHHRWQIEEGQISNYGLGGTLDRRKIWWENIGIQRRKLHFFTVRPELVVCPLICEDLARQDPVAELVRSVGPNLVIALLMDGPQISTRWSARYATVLADDPGSSVLTISSLGMVRLSKPRGQTCSRVVASWKDSFGSFVPLELGEKESALILNVQFRGQDERSVDGRSDGGVASTPVLCGIHPLVGN